MGVSNLAAPCPLTAAWFLDHGLLMTPVSPVGSIPFLMFAPPPCVSSACFFHCVSSALAPVEEESADLQWVHFVGRGGPGI